MRYFKVFAKGLFRVGQVLGTTVFVFILWRLFFLGILKAEWAFLLVFLSVVCGSGSIANPYHSMGLFTREKAIAASFKALLFGFLLVVYGAVTWVTHDIWRDFAYKELTWSPLVGTFFMQLLGIAATFAVKRWLIKAREVLEKVAK